MSLLELPRVGPSVWLISEVPVDISCVLFRLLQLPCLLGRRLALQASSVDVVCESVRLWMYVETLAAQGPSSEILEKAVAFVLEALQKGKLRKVSKPWPFDSSSELGVSHLHVN